MAHTRSLLSLALAMLTFGLAFGLAAGMDLPRIPSAAPTGPQQHTNQFAADADSFVSSVVVEAGTNFGTDTTLRVGAATTLGGLTNYRSFVRFDAVTQTLAADAVVDQASLKLSYLGSPGTLTILTEVVTDTWTEAGITWLNQPGSTVPLASTTVTTTAGVITWDVTAHVQAWVDGNLPNNGLVLRPISEDIIEMKPFSSRETDDGGGEPPVMLEVTWHSLNPTATTTPTSTETPTSTTTATPTVTGSPTSTPTNTVTATATLTTTLTPTLTATATTAVTATATLSSTPTTVVATATPASPTSDATVTATVTGTVAVPTGTATPSVTPTQSVATATATGTAVTSPTATSSPVTPTWTVTPTHTPVGPTPPPDIYLPFLSRTG